MEKKHHTIDELFNEKLANFEVEPPPYVLDNIHTKLDAKTQKKRFIFWLSFAATVAIVLSFGAGYLISNVQTDRINTTANNEPNLNRKQALPNNSGETTRSEKHLSEEKSSNAYENQSLMNQSETEKAIVEEFNKEKDILAQKEQMSSIKTPNVPTQNPLVVSNNHSRVPTNVIKETDDTKLQQKTGLNQKVDNEGGVASQIGAPITTSDNIVDGSVSSPVKNEIVVNNHSENITQTREGELVVPENDESVVVNEDKTKEEPIDIANNVLDKKRSMSIKAYFSPIMPIMNATANQDRFYSATSSGNTFKHSPEFSYGAGFDIGYDINKNWSISIGFAYNQIGMTTNRSALQMQKFGGDENPDGFLSDVYTSTGRIEGLSVYQDVTGSTAIFNTDKGEIGNTLSISQRFGFIEVPIKAQYKHTWGRVSILATAGLSTGFLVRNQAYAVGENSRTYIGESGAMNNVNFNAIVGTGIEVRILPFLSFAVEPMFRYSFVNWSKDSENGFNVKPMFLNLNTGLIFKL